MSMPKIPPLFLFQMQTPCSQLIMVVGSLLCFALCFDSLPGFAFLQAAFVGGRVQGLCGMSEVPILSCVCMRLSSIPGQGRKIYVWL